MRRQRFRAALALLIGAGRSGGFELMVGTANWEPNGRPTTAAHVLRIDGDGRLSKVANVTTGPNPAWLCSHRGAEAEEKVVVACDETHGVGRGGVESFGSSGGTWRRAHDLQPWPADPTTFGPCHCAIDNAGGYVIASDWSEGNAAVFPIVRDGGSRPALGAPQQLLEYGNASHAHCAAFSADGRHAYVVDLGLDCVHEYAFDAATGKLAPIGRLPFPAGAHPRHLTFHPQMPQYAYLITEASNEMFALRHDPRTGRLSKIHAVSTLPNGTTVASTAAEVKAHGSFVYGSNRGHNSVVVYHIDAASGRLATVGWATDPEIRQPRGMGLSPAGDFLVVGSRDTGDVLSYRANGTTGALSLVEAYRDDALSGPTCVEFL